MSAVTECQACLDKEEELLKEARKKLVYWRDQIERLERSAQETRRQLIEAYKKEPA